MNNITFTRRSRKSLLGTRTRKGLQAVTIEELPSVPIIAETPIFPKTSPVADRTITEKAEKKTNFAPSRKSVVCALFNNDSFEENETMLANSSGNETILANTLLMTARKEDNSMQMTARKEDDSMQQISDIVKLLLKKNADAIENNFQERDVLKESRASLMKTHNLKSTQSLSKSPDRQEIYTKYQISPKKITLKLG